MSRLLRIAASLIALSTLTACTVIPPQFAYTGPGVGIVTVGAGHVVLLDRELF